jgi:hypothetical protein
LNSGTHCAKAAPSLLQDAAKAGVAPSKRSAEKTPFRIVFFDCIIPNLLEIVIDWFIYTILGPCVP